MQISSSTYAHFEHLNTNSLRPDRLRVDPNVSGEAQADGLAQHGVWSSPFLKSKLPLAGSTPLLDGRGQNGTCIPALLHHREPNTCVEDCSSFALTEQLPLLSQFHEAGARGLHSESGEAHDDAEPCPRRLFMPNLSLHPVLRVLPQSSCCGRSPPALAFSTTRRQTRGWPDRVHITMSHS